ncbi:hypothetical protein P3339_18945 [Microbulbifer sp. MLAF003]|nr:hypothetical protein [Microbulbifer sp. MLAF003]WHI50495.1 hypothetical protein P3339_18945 [Microbulbifer sp. MLAF003]
MKDKVKEDDTLNDSIKDFLQLDLLRNKLAHNNYAIFYFSLTVEDVRERFYKTLDFVKSLQECPKDFSKLRQLEI